MSKEKTEKNDNELLDYHIPATNIFGLCGEWFTKAINPNKKYNITIDDKTCPECVKKHDAIERMKKSK